MHQSELIEEAASKFGINLEGKIPLSPLPENAKISSDDSPEEVSQEDVTKMRSMIGDIIYFNHKTYYLVCSYQTCYTSRQTFKITPQICLKFAVKHADMVSVRMHTSANMFSGVAMCFWVQPMSGQRHIEMDICPCTCVCMFYIYIHVATGDGRT
mmetsp:Transcript_51292/g.127718  ORF Transcript_51292/g.127718 Transcript_51292/m.127718 type:complete len:155 (-) Transcript_51292:590-1054(-)